MLVNSIELHILVRYFDIQLEVEQRLLVQVKVKGMELEMGMEQDQEPIDR